MFPVSSREDDGGDPTSWPEHSTDEKMRVTSNLITRIPEHGFDRLRHVQHLYIQRSLFKHVSIFFMFCTKYDEPRDKLLLPKV